MSKMQIGLAGLERAVPVRIRRSSRRQTIDLDRTPPTPLPVLLGTREVTFSATAFRDRATGEEALALVMAEPEKAAAAPLVRIHSGCVTGDIFHSLRCDCRAQLELALGAILKAGEGAVIYLPRHEGRGIGLFAKIHAYGLQDEGLDTVDANTAIGQPVDARRFDVAAAILLDLGMARVRLLTNNPEKLGDLSASGVEIAERVPLLAEPKPQNARYMSTKRARLHHML